MGPNGMNPSLRDSKKSSKNNVEAIGTSSLISGFVNLDGVSTSTILTKSQEFRDKLGKYKLYKKAVADTSTDIPNGTVFGFDKKNGFNDSFADNTVDSVMNRSSYSSENARFYPYYPDFYKIVKKVENNGEITLSFPWNRGNNDYYSVRKELKYDKWPYSVSEINVEKNDFGFNEISLNKEGNESKVPIQNSKKVGVVYREGKSFNGIGGDAADDYMVIGEVSHRGPKSLIEYTNSLFNQGAIHSLINRFHDDSNTEESTIQSGVDKHEGMSRGRNLISEKRESSTGFDNPYCRVWTPLRPYGRYHDAIRSKSYDEVKFFEEGSEASNELRPNKAISRLKELSTLSSTGKPIIGPIGNKDNIKRCMFSIENLAWKTGKNNHGRIMWFPPYNLKFSEQVRSRWNNNTFIGRGEDIYTYTNTERNGQLSFTMLIDHPSVLNTWRNNYGSDETEKDALRYIAGCGEKTGLDEIEYGISNDENVIKSKEININEGCTQLKFNTIIFFPYRYTGQNDTNNPKGIDDLTPFEYLMNGNGFEIDEEGNGYEMNGESGLSKGINHPKNGWYYRVEPYSYIKNNGDKKESLVSYKDMSSFSLNSSDDILNDDWIKSHVDTEGKERFIKFSELYKIMMSEGREAETAVGKEFYKCLQNSRQCMLNFNSSVSSVEDAEDAKNDQYGRMETITKWMQRFMKTSNDENGDLSIQPYFIPAVKTYTTCDYPENKNKYDINDEKIKKSNFVMVEFVIYMNNYANKPVLTESSILNESKQNRSKLINMGVAPKKSYESVILKMKSKREIDVKNLEYEYFRDLEKDDNVLYEKLIEKVKNFNPAFHSITPEGFNARLTFLQQCMRQGPTNSSSEVENNNENGYGNLAFGKPPYCILKLGDFLNIKVIITDVNIDYGDGLWDLNPEGIGIQPMMANVTLNLTFTGGADIGGPIEKLQNAVSFNYYSNTSVYDERAEIGGISNNGWKNANEAEIKEDEIEGKMGFYFNNEIRPNDERGEIIKVPFAPVKKNGVDTEEISYTDYTGKSE